MFDVSMAFKVGDQRKPEPFDSDHLSGGDLSGMWSVSDQTTQPFKYYRGIINYTSKLLCMVNK